jgi:hypothetical protein
MSFWDRVFHRKKAPQPREVYAGLRAMALGITADQIGADAANDAVYGVLMDMGVGNGTATLVSLADGTTSLYTTGGGGIIGGGGHEIVAAASKTLVGEAERQRALLASDWQDTPIGNGEIRLIALTPHKQLVAQAKSAELADGDHALSPLFAAANDVISRLRENSRG